MYPKMAVSPDAPYFGKIIDKSFFEEDLEETAIYLRKQGKSVFDLLTAKEKMSVEENKYVFINIYERHASIIVVNKTLFDDILFPPIWGQMLDGPSLEFQKDFKADTIHLKQYHVRMNKSGTNYYVTCDKYDMLWLKKSRSFYVGESALAESFLNLLCLTVVSLRFRLIMDDCLEFAKQFAKEIAVRENNIPEKRIHALFRTLSVSELYPSAKVKQASRNNPKSGLSVYISYFRSFRVELLLTSITFMIAMVICYAFIFKASRHI